MSAECLNALLEQKYARIAIHPAQVMAASLPDPNKMNLSLDSSVQVAINAPLSPSRNVIVDPAQKAVFQIVTEALSSGISFDQLLSKLEVSVPALQVVLSQLEKEGWINQKGALFIQLFNNDAHRM